MRNGVVAFALGLALTVLTLPRSASAAPCTDTEWLSKAYGDLLFRPPTQNELAAWINPNSRQLNNGATRFEVAWAIATSNEGIGYLLGLYPHTVSGYFQEVLGRAPAGVEFNAFYATLGFPQGNAPDFALLALIIGGQLGQFSYPGEFSAYAAAQNPGLAACSPNSAIVNQIFEVYMGRGATQSELDLWSAQLSQGAALQEVALGVSGTFDLGVGQGTGEYFNRAVREAYARFYRRSPSANELVGWSNVLAQSGLNQELWAVLMSADEYCSGTMVFTSPAPIDAAILASGGALGTLVSGSPAPTSVTELGPDPVAAANAQAVTALRNQVAAQNQVITQLTCGVGGSPIGVAGPPIDTVGGGGGDVFQVCDPTGSITPPDVVIQSLTGEIGALQTQVATLSTTLTFQGQTIADQQATIVSLTDVELGLGVDSNAAAAARRLVQDEIQTATPLATGPASQRSLAHARQKLAMGDADAQGGAYAQAVHDYTDAYRDAARAVNGKP
jgi:hypothetical protein